MADKEKKSHTAEMKKSDVELQCSSEREDLECVSDKGASCLQRNILLQTNSGNSLKDSEDYVSSVMSSQPLLAVLRTPLPSVPSGRKRHLSMPAASGSDLKKVRGDMGTAVRDAGSENDVKCDEEEEEERKSAEDIKRRVVAKARRNLMRDTSENKGNPKTSRDRLKNKASKNRKGSGVNNQQQKETNTNSSTDVRSRKRRNAKGKKGEECDSETITGTADVHKEGNNDNNMAEIVDIVDKESGGNISEQNFLSVMNRFADEMSKMANSMSKMKDDLNQRMDSIANDIEKRLANKISNIVDKRVNAESSKLSKAMNKRIDDIRDDMNAEI